MVDFTESKGYLSLRTFSSEWPYQVTTRFGVGWAEAWSWLNERADLLGVLPLDYYTSFSNKDFAFKDKKTAVEFELRFG